jgi:hypothetical protein
MRKFLIPLAAAASTLAIASPASAQWYPQPAPYAAPYAHNSIAVARSMEARVQNLRAQIRGFDRRNLLTRNQARSLDRQALNLQRQIMRNTRYGLSVRERVALERRIVRLEQRVHQRVASNMHRGNRYAYGNRYYGYRR